MPHSVRSFALLERLFKLTAMLDTGSQCTAENALELNYRVQTHASIHTALGLLTPVTDVLSAVVLFSFFVDWLPIVP
jgi:hypothetical protein